MFAIKRYSYDLQISFNKFLIITLKYNTISIFLDQRLSFCINNDIRLIFLFWCIPGLQHVTPMHRNEPENRRTVFYQVTIESSHLELDRFRSRQRYSRWEDICHSPIFLIRISREPFAFSRLQCSCIKEKCILKIVLILILNMNFLTKYHESSKRDFCHFLL